MEKQLIKKRIKSQVEKDTPIIKPEDCPGAIIKWVTERDEELIKRIEQTIDRLFDKHFKKYVTMVFTNRIMIIILGAFLSGIYGIMLYHLYK